MSLSLREQRTLQTIEAHCRATDPAFAAQFERIGAPVTGPPAVSRRGLLRAIAEALRLTHRAN